MRKGILLLGTQGEGAGRTGRKAQAAIYARGLVHDQPSLGEVKGANGTQAYAAAAGAAEAGVDANQLGRIGRRTE